MSNLFDPEDPEDVDDVTDLGGDTLVIPEKINYKARDVELYNNWAQTKSKKDMSKLLQHLGPLLGKEVRNISGTLPTAGLSGEVKVWAVKGIKTFDPSKGFALSTHITNYIKRGKRLNYKYQNAARIPESMHLDFKNYNLAKTQLLDELNEEPTNQHLADRLGWSKNKVERFVNRIYSDHIESKTENPTEKSRYSDEDLMMKNLLSRLTDREKDILKYKGKISSTELADKLGVKINRLNYETKNLTKKIHDLKLELGI